MPVTYAGDFVPTKSCAIVVLFEDQPMKCR